MTNRTFWLGLLGTTIVTSLITAGMHLIPRLSADWPLSIIAIVIFILLSIGIFFFGKRTAASSNKFAFNNIVLGTTFFKMFISGGLIAAYVMIAQPTDKIFVFPFFLIYMLFTAYEVYVLTKLARITS